MPPAGCRPGAAGGAPPACTVQCDAPQPRLPPRRPQVLINASFYAQHLPRSLAGVVYFDDVAMADKIQATRIYVQMLDHYPHLHEGSIPLLEISRKALIAAGQGEAAEDARLTTDAEAHGLPLTLNPNLSPNPNPKP